MREDFSQDTIDSLKARAGYACSFPGCHAPTSGPSQESATKTANTGVAAHICAASQGKGARRRLDLSKFSKSLLSDYSNGIWMCETHAKLIDTDEVRFTVEMLSRWRELAELRASLGQQTGRSVQVHLHEGHEVPLAIVERSVTGVSTDVMNDLCDAVLDSCIVDVWGKDINDRFLQKYEQSAFYDSTPAHVWGQWYCSPSYRGQWSFTECRRVGRNLVQVPMRELYKPKPDREIVLARSFAVDPADLAHVDLNEEHVVAKVQRLLDVLLRLGDGLSTLGTTVGLNKVAVELTGFDRAEVAANGWLAYPTLSRLAQVAPLNMTQQMFLARCKSLHEVWQRVPNGYLKSLLERAGCPRGAVKDIGSLKLLQALLNVIERLNAHEEASDAFASGSEPEGWNDRNEAVAPLFLNNDLRIADAHETVEQCLTTLQLLGFDTANVNAGYGRALDFVMDGVITALGTVATAIEKLLRPK